MLICMYLFTEVHDAFTPVGAVLIR